MKNLVFFDIDGTIVAQIGSKHVIPKSASEALKLLRSNGNLCFINSGRTMSEMDDEVLGLDVDGFVCGCGTYISYKDEVLFTKTIPVSFGNEIIKDLDECGLEWLLEGRRTLYYSARPYKTRIKDFQREHMSVCAKYCRLVKPRDAVDLEFDKFCVCVSKGSRFEAFKRKHSDRLTFIDRGGGFFEITPIGCSKATGMRFLMDYFHVPIENTYAVGDGANDIPMIDFAGTGIVMGDGEPEAAMHADYVTDGALDDGIYNAMKHFGLI